MHSVTAGLHIVVLSVLLGSSSIVQAGENFVLLVSPATGAVAMRSDYSSTVWIDQYSITSAAGSLRPLQWNSLNDQQVPGWVETAASLTLLSESNTVGETSFQAGTGFSLGAAFASVGFPQDLVLHYRLAGSATPILGTVQYGFFTPPPNPVQEPMPCFGDIDGSGAVSVPDLLLIINSWGPCSPPPASCPADIAPPISGDGTVSVPDLLGIINNWGACD